MALHLYNTLSHKTELFEPIESGKVHIYTCGPTVYAPAHIGNLRTFMFEDILRRYLEYSGFDVTHVMNITDIDDKTISQAISEDTSMVEMTDAIAEKFSADLSALNILPAHHLPKATEYVDQMKVGIQTLLDKGAAYITEDGSVFYNIGRDTEYGQLVHIEATKLRSGARTAEDDYGKDEARDFALWKAKKSSDGPYSWHAPWGEGRPGWHMECSIMSSHYLGEHFDIHCGGVDNIFPHHENELAQSRSMFESKFVNYWIHGEHLIVDGEKMSKSLNNFYTLDDILARGYSAEAIRYALLSTHHRQQLNFSFDKVEKSESVIQRLRELVRRLKEAAAAEDGEADVGNHNPFTLPTHRWESEEKALSWRAQKRLSNELILNVTEGSDKSFDAKLKVIARALGVGMVEPPDDAIEEAMDDDLNISAAIGTIFRWANRLDKALDHGLLTSSVATTALAALGRYDQILGVIFTTGPAENEEQIVELVKEREAARTARDWDRADALRDELQSMGVSLKDTTVGTTWKRDKS